MVMVLTPRSHHHTQHRARFGLLLLFILRVRALLIVNGFVGEFSAADIHRGGTASTGKHSLGFPRPCHWHRAISRRTLTRSELHNDNDSDYGRRLFLTQSVALASSSYFHLTAAWPLVFMAQSASGALPLPFASRSAQKRQLELCLVAVLRTKYWAMSVAHNMKMKLLLLGPTTIITDSSTEINSDTRRQPTPTPSPDPNWTENDKKSSYLEARLGAKALLTQRIGGGANIRVLKLGGFQLKECLDDAKFWCRQYAQTNPSLLQSSSSSMAAADDKIARRICSYDLSNAIDDLVESLASIVEFDGLETTIDPSPRSSLMLSMYNNEKGIFVYRILLERVVPSCERVLAVFGRERREIVEEFVRRNYKDELPPPIENYAKNV